MALLCVVFSCVFVTFTYGVMGQVWYYMVLIPDLCLHLYFSCVFGVFWLESCPCKCFIALYVTLAGSLGRCLNTHSSCFVFI